MRVLFRLARLLVLLVVALVILLLVAQDAMIYHPRPYRGAQPVTRTVAGRQVLPLVFSTSQGRQQCYYVCARSAGTTQVLGPIWVLFCGNASLALGWLTFVNATSTPDDSFLLVEYPGYGVCVGHPSPATIEENANAALAALAERSGVPVSALTPSLRVFGHSLGAAAALVFAGEHPVSRVVLAAPFTSLRDMAQRTVGWPLCWLLRGNFDNRARLREIGARTPAPIVEIFSGTADEVIPFTMGRALGELSPCAHFEAVQDAGHDDVLDVVWGRVFKATTKL